MNRLFAFVLLALGFASTSHAAYIPATWTDSASFGAGQPVGWFQSFTYTHDLTDNGFRPMEDVITGFNLSVDVADDAGDAWWEFGGEQWLVTKDPLYTRYELSGDAFGGFTILGLLNELGTLTVTISSVWGDFNVLGSTLTAWGGSNTNVPEPGALGLLGVGLVGVALSMRRRKQVRA
jgi:hypothetical protein